MSVSVAEAKAKVLNEICNEVIEQIRPGAKEQAEVKALTELIITNLNSKAVEMGIDAHAISVGSTARNTWVSGEADIDIFIMFPVETSDQDLKEKGLALAKSVSDRYEERYASHPYIHAYFHFADREYEVDLVPCFAVKDPPD